MTTSPPPPFWSRDGFNQSFSTFRSAFIVYARWLDSISWKRFFLLSVLAIACAGILSELPPFSIRWGGDRVMESPIEVPAVPRPPRTASSHHPRASLHGPIVLNDKGYEVRIDETGVHIGPAASGSGSSAASAAAADVAASAASAASVAAAASDDGADEDNTASDTADEVRDAIEEARNAAAEVGPHFRTTPSFRLGDLLMNFVMLMIFVSVTIKVMAKGRFQAEAKAVVATEMAESEALKRQVIEARMAAMQAQVEPHFLFNTLASIDHLIETDPKRASVMQKNLIALLRASMPTMREANAPGTRGVRDLGRELAVIRPYLEILKVRMEERLATDVRVSDGLLSAEFPPMMLQSLVENAIKHGLEPKPAGGTLRLLAEVVHGKLAVTVADDGVGFGRAATAGTGIGLNNIRERLALLYGGKATLTVTEPAGGGTSVTITLPYVTHANVG